MPEIRKFLIRDEKVEYGYLYYDTGSKEFTIKFNQDVDYLKAPALVSLPIEAGKYELTGAIALAWVRERLIPPGRHNISDILYSKGLTEYSEIELLASNLGLCCQDSMWLEEVSDSIKLVYHKIVNLYNRGIECSEIARRLNIPVSRVYQLRNLALKRGICKRAT